MADGRHFENRYISIHHPRIARIWRNLVCRLTFDPGDGNVTKIQKFTNSRWRTDAILKIILTITRLHNYCPPIKMKFGVRRQNHTHTKVRWSKCLVTKIQYGGKSLYLRIFSANRPNVAKFGTQTQILIQPRKHHKHKTEINIKRANIFF